MVYCLIGTKLVFVLFRRRLQEIKFHLGPMYACRTSLRHRCRTQHCCHWRQCEHYTLPIINIRVQVIAAEGENKAAHALREASDIINESSSAMQLRYLQTLNSISAEKNSTIIFPLPIEFLTHFMRSGNGNNGSKGGGGNRGGVGRSSSKKRSGGHDGPLPLPAPPPVKEVAVVPSCPSPVSTDEAQWSLDCVAMYWLLRFVRCSSWRRQNIAARRMWRRRVNV